MRKRTSSTKRFREQARQKRQEDKDRRRAERKAAKDSGTPEAEPTAESVGTDEEGLGQDFDDEPEAPAEDSGAGQPAEPAQGSPPADR